MFNRLQLQILCVHRVWTPYLNWVYGAIFARNALKTFSFSTKGVDERYEIEHFVRFQDYDIYILIPAPPPRPAAFRTYTHRSCLERHLTTHGQLLYALSWQRRHLRALFRKRDADWVEFVNNDTWWNWWQKFLKLALTGKKIRHNVIVQEAGKSRTRKTLCFLLQTLWNSGSVSGPLCQTSISSESNGSALAIVMLQWRQFAIFDGNLLSVLIIHQLVWGPSLC